VYTVGEIFVIPDGNANDANSGLMGVLSRVEFLVTDINDQIYSDDLRVYPNPSSQSVVFETIAANPIKEVFMYNNAGQLVLSSPVTGKVDISNLKDGLYFIKTSANDTKSIKIIKQ